MRFPTNNASKQFIETSNVLTPTIKMIRDWYRDNKLMTIIDYKANCRFPKKQKNECSKYI